MRSTDTELRMSASSGSMPPPMLTDIATFARATDWAVVTENVVDFARESDLVLVFVLTRSLPAGGAQAGALAELLDRWVREHPDPYLGAHWPR